ncbi:MULTISPECIES: siphovirus ReqiPepy6 Gp37-like family protein [Bacillus]|uniref:siphovirus ReqiPepy6 Gp37-like family protein n=1 Tax=Bacillus TaxID=1386 RepID=UPI0002FD7B8E|nr:MULTISPECIES: siphovirus ReqiPepy6 Gp37-like family protein [Bacillus]
MELYVFDMELNHLGMIDEFIQVESELHYTKMSYLYLSVEGNKENIDLLQKGRILVKSNDLSRGYVIPRREYEDEQSSILQIIAPSFNVLLHRRIVLGQQVYTDNLEYVIKKFIYYNAINTTQNRKIPHLDVDFEYKCDLEDGTESAANVHLDDLSYDLCNKYDCSWDIFIDLENKKFVYTTWKGTDRSAEQSENPHIIFSKDSDNVLKQNYVEDDSDYRTTAIVEGEEEGLTRRTVIVNDELSGFDRIEMFVDANSVKKTYKNENDQEVTLTDTEYNSLLKAEGEKALSEYQKITTFESDVDLYSNNIFGVDYFLGDKVSIRNDDLDIILHTRIVSVIETVNKSGTSLKVNFGSNVPNLIDKIKRAVK